MAKNSQSKWLILLALGLFTFMSTLDSSIVNIALPTISRDLAVPMNEATWTVSIYLIVISGLLIFFGRLGDMIGKIKVFKIGTYIFTFGSLLAGISAGLPFLLFARFVQAIGAAMTMSNSFGITTVTFPPEQRGRAMGLIAMFVSIGAVAGPGLGGLILQYLPWSYIFWVNVPIGIVTIIMGQILFPKSSSRGAKPKIDWAGAIVFFIMIVALFMGVNVGQAEGFLHPTVIGMIILAIVLFIIFVKVEKREKIPLINLAIFKNSMFSISLLTGMLVFITNNFFVVIMPFYLQNLRGWTPGTSGLLMMTFPIVMAVMAPIGGILGDKFDKEVITMIGLVLIMVAQIGYTLIGATTGFVLIAIFNALNGAGAALFNSPNNALVMGTVEPQYLGVAGSVNALARNLGMIIGISTATTALFGWMSMSAGYRVTTYLPKHPMFFSNAMHYAFMISMVLAVIAFGLTFYRWNLSRKARLVTK
ncbi:MFS transporter [Periweissella cryptocerci]|nr:MFS transporter [Periweissella cryptocerci]